MDSEIIKELINNAALLLALSIVYEFSYIIPIKKNLTQLMNGLLIGLIGIAIMLIPFTLTTGVVFDTRSILIGVTALKFGTIPTLIVVLFTGIFRLIQGGAGVYAGLAVILACAGIGLFWRHYLPGSMLKFRWLNRYLFGLTIHLAMLACMLILPWPLSTQVLNAISLPVMVIYPVGTVLLSLLLFQQEKRNEAMLQVMEAEERYRGLFKNNHAIMLLIDPQDGSIVDVNEAAVEFYGWPVEIMKSMKITQINTLSPEEIKIAMKTAFAEKRKNFLFRHRKSSGELVDVEVYSGPLVQEGRNLIYSIVHDISERVASEKSLKESEQRFRMLVDGAPDAIFIWISGYFAFVNQAAVNLYGAESAQQLLGLSVLARIHPDYEEAAKARIHIINEERKAVPPMEQIHVRLDGKLVNVDVTAVPIDYQDKSGGMVFVRNITERKKLETEKLEIEAQLRQQQRLEAIGTLAGGVAHEINNPINGIMNYAQLILDSLEKDTANAEYAREIIYETERVSTIVKNLLQFSRHEKQAHSYASIEDIIHQTISLTKNIIKKDQIDLQICLDKELPEVKCRSQQIQQVLMNLLINAKDALNEKYPEYHENKIIRVFCKQYESEDRRWIRITVEDHGNGISEGIREKIFEPFFSTKPKDKGTGLGLSISFGIIKDHHGTLNIDTVIGSYTCFNIDLPVDNGWKI